MRSTLYPILSAMLFLPACAPSTNAPGPQPTSEPASRPAGEVTPAIEPLSAPGGVKNCEQDPTFTPDGSAIIYATFVDGGWGLMRYDLKTKQRARLTMQNAQVWEYLESYDVAPAVSPDGKRIAYLHRTNQGAEVRVLPINGDADTDPQVVGGASSGQETSPVWTSADQLLFVGADGGLVEYRVGPPSTKLQTLPRPSEQYFAGALQNDAKTIVARVRSLTNLNAWSFVLRGPGDKDWAFMTLETGIIGPLMRGGFALSRDGKELYHVSGNSFASSRIARRRITAARTVGEALPGIAHVTGGFDISVDRRMLVYSECYEYSDLIRVRRGKPPTPVLAATNSGGHVQPRRSANNQVLYTTRHEGTSSVGSFDLKTKKEIEDFLGCDCEQATVAPDGRHVAYLKHTHPGAPGGLRIRALGDALGNEIVLTRDPTDRGPEWFHDSQHLLFKRGGRSAAEVLQIMAIKGDLEPRPLTALGPVNLYAPSPTEDRIVFTIADNTFFVATSEGKSREPLSAKLGTTVIFNRVVFSPDGKRVLILRGGRELVEIALKGTRTPELLTDLGQTDTWYMDYAPDGDGVIVPLSVFRGGMSLARGEFR